MRDLQKLAQYAARRKRSRRFRGVLTAIAAVVVFCTTYALILPAITLEGQSVYCGFEDHTHTEDCYQLACGKEEFIPHYHSAECRDENGDLICHQEETTIHVHSDQCKVALTCTQPEREAHRHSEGCYETQSVLVCGSEEAPGHTHGEGCYQSVNVCGLEETPGHAHGEGCYAEDGSLSCTQSESAGHSHSEGCFTSGLVCTQEETPGHSHTESCYEAQSVLICQKEEGEGHSHNDDCYGTFDDFRCGQEGKEAHAHTASCFTLVCDAHVHTEECYVKPQEDPTQVTGEEEQSIQEEETIEEDKEEIIQEDEEEIIQEDEEEIIQEDEAEAEEPSVRDLLLEIYTEEELQELLEAYPDCTLEDIWTQLNTPPAQEGPEAEPEEGSEEEPEEAGEEAPSGECVFTVDKPGWKAPEQTNHPLRSAAFAMARETPAEAVDLGQYITTVSIQKLVNNIWMDSTEFTEGDYVQVRITYSIEAGVVGEGRRVVSYQLPSGITPIQEATGSVYFGGQDVGTYAIGTDGQITITFSESFANYEAFTGNIYFRGSVSAGDDGQGGQVTFPGSGGTITIQPKPSDPGETGQKHDISAAKTGAILGDDTIQYTLEVSTQNGTKEGEKITIGDYFQAGDGAAKGDYVEGSFAVKKVTTEGETSLTDYTLEVDTSGEQQSFQITGLDPLAAGEKYVVTYQAKANGAKQDGSAMLQNHVYAKGGSDESHQWINTELSKTRIGKSGWNDAENNVIHWTITINDAGKDLAGWKINDFMTIGGQTVTLNNVDFTIKDSAGNVLKDNGSPVTSLPYTFPEGTENTNKYTITYTTPTGEINEGTEVTNTASLEKDGTQFTVPATVTVNHRTWGLSKYKEYSDEASVDGVQEYRWNAQVTIPSGNLTSFTYTDTIQDPVDAEGTAQPGKHYGIAADIETALRTGLKLEMEDGSSITYLTAAENNVTITVTYYADTGRTVTVDPTDNTTPVRAFTVTVTVTPKEGTTVTGAKRLHIEKYPTKADYSAMDIGDTWTVKNTGQVEDLTRTSEVSYTKPAPLEKAVSVPAQWGGSSYVSGPATIQYDEVNGKISYRLLWRNLSGTDDAVVLTDILPAGLSLTGNAAAAFYASEHYTWTVKQQYIDGTQVTYDLAAQVQTSSVENPQDGTTAVTITIPAGHNLDGRNDPIAVYYEAEIDWPSLAQNTVTFRNTASWGTYGASQDTTVERDIPVVQKTGVQLTDGENPTDVVEYTVVINPGAKDLDPNSKVLELTDTLTLPDGVQAYLDMEHTKLYAYSSAAENNRGDEVSAQRYQISFDQQQHTFTVKLPDQLACVLVYRYAIDRGDTNTVALSNGVELNGQWSGDNQISLQSDTSGASVVKRGKVTVKKVDSEDFTKGLAGASFLVEWYNPDSAADNKWEPVAPSDGTDGDDSLSADGSFTTDENGEKVFFKDYNTALPTEKLIRLTETAPPQGYRMDTTANVRYFVIYPNTITLAAAKEGVQAAITGSGIDASLVSYYQTGTDVVIYVPNESTAVRVQKIWLDEKNNQMADGPQPVTVQLYSQPMAKRYYTVTVESYWSASPESQDRYNQKTERIQVDHGSPLTITISCWDDVEKRHTVTVGSEQPQIMTYTKGADGVPSTYTYTIDSVNQEDLTVHVVTSVDGASTDFTLSGYTLPGWAASGDKKAVGSPVTLDSTNNWSYTWTDLQAAEGTDPYYVVLEQDVPAGYSVTYTNNGIKTGEITVLNQKRSTALNVQKLWKDVNGKTIDPPADASVTLNLMRKSAEGEDTQVATVTLTAETGWSHQFTGLSPTASYYVVEQSVPDGWAVSYSHTAEEPAMPDDPVTVTNTKLSVAVEKKWLDVEGNSEAADVTAAHDPITVKLQKQTNGETNWVDTGKTLTLSSDNGWKGSFTDLDGNALYRVEELDVSGYIVSYSDNNTAGISSGTITVTNQKQRELVVNKQWFKADGTEITNPIASSVSFDLYRAESTTPPDETQSGSGETGGEVTVTLNIGQWDANGTVYSKQIQCAPGSTITFSITEPDAYSKPIVKLGGYWDEGAEILKPVSEPKEPPYTFVYSYQVKTSITISGTTQTGSTATVSEPTVLPPAPPQGTKIGTYTISKADNWTWRMTGLPVTGVDASGNTLYYTYYVVEQPVTNYTPSYSNNLGIPSGTITIKNTAVENPTITLPQTGGTGTGLYTLAGLTLCAGAALGLMKKRRKGDCD